MAEMNETLFKTVTGNMPGVIFMLDKEGIFTLSDGKGLEKPGLQPGQVVGRSVFEVYKDSPDICESIRRALKGNEHHSTTQVGELFFEIWYVPTRDEQGQVNGVLGIANDVTERKLTEAALRESETFYQTIFNASPVMFWVKDTKNRMLQINQAAANLEGVNPKDMAGRSSYDVYPKEQADAFYADDLAVIRSGRPKLGIVEAHTSPGTGETMWLETGKIPTHNEKGEITGVLAFAIDITKSKQAEQTIRESDERQRQILEAAPVATFITRIADGQVLYANGETGRMFKENVESLVGKATFDFYVDPDDRQSILNNLQETGYVRNKELRFKRSDGEPFWALASVHPLKFGKESNALLTSVTDITERKHAEQLILESEERFRRFTDATVEGLVFHEQGKITDVNPAAIRLFGFSDVSEIIGRNLLEFILPEWHEMVLKQMQMESVSSYEIQCVRRDGSTFPVETSTRAYKYGEHTIRASSIRDITERKKLEKEIQESLERRGYQIETTRQVAQEMSTAPDLETLFPLIVTLIKERFGYYHAQIFRYDSDQDAVVLVAGYGEAGQKMLAAGHKLTMGRGVVGTSAQTRKPILATDASQDPDWRPNPNLPDTKGELAVPIKFRDEILGILDVQSDTANTLSQDDVLLLENLTGQIAIVIENARVLDESNIFRQGIEQSDQAVFATKPDGTITYVNAAFEKIYGYKAQEAIGKNPRIIKSGMIPQEQYQHFWDALLNKQSVVGELINKTKDGRLVNVEGSNNPILNRKGEIVAFIAVHRDITDRKLAEESLRQNQARLAEALRTAQMGYWESDLSKGIFNFNDQFYEMLHTTAEKEGGYVMSIARYTKRFVHPEDADLVEAEIQKAVASPERHYNSLIEHRILYADGGAGYVSVRINIEKDEQGQITRVYGAHQDITDRKKADIETQETLRELERLYQSMSQSGWSTYQNEMQAASSYTYDNLKIEEKSIWTPEIATAVETKTTLKPEESNRPAVAPLFVRGEVIGALGVTGNREISDEDISMLESIAEQVALALESARLFGQTQQALNQANTFRQLVNATTQGIGMSNLQSKMVYANEALVKIFGEENAEQIIGKEITHYYPGHLRDYFAEQVLGTVMQKDTWTGELDVSSRTGKDIPTINNVFLVKDDNGTPQFVANVITDITERKQAEQSLRRQNEYLATAAEVGRLITSTLDLPTLFERTVNLLQSSFGYYHVAIFTVDDSGFSASLREATGEAGRLMKEQKHSIPVGSKSVVGSVTLNGTTLVVNDTALDPLHRPNPLLLETRAEAGIPLKIGSRVIGTLDIQAQNINAFLADDIAVLETLSDQISIAIDNARSYEIAQKAADELRETDRIRSQFLANMSHELRTPLNSIIGFSRVILKGIDGPITDQQNQDLSAIYNSGQHLLGLINDVLDLSKIEAGKMELATEEMNILDTISSVMSTAIGLVKDKPVKFKQEIEPDLPTIRADPMRLRQVLLNLISNASKFTDEGFITVTAKLHTSSTGTSEIMVGVTDTGPGISLEDQKKLFLAFSQVDASATRKSGGTGLGLSICQRLIDMHGGKIGVHSTEGKGSTFYFTVPTYQQPSMESSLGEGKIILCIDDDPQVISLYERYLKPQGFQVIPLTNPANARDSVKRIKPYAVTLDIMMPGIDGWQVLEDLKSDPETRGTPVIVCSIVEEDEKGFSLGAADYLVKPISETDLITALNRMGGDGNIKDILVIDDSPDDLRLMGKIVTEHGQFRPILAEGGEKGWEILITERPQAVILDLFMPGLDGFGILERLRTTPELRDIPVIVISGMDLTAEQKKQLENLGQQLLQKGMLSEQELFSTLEKALKRLESKGKQG